MGIGIGIFLIAAGLILALAVPGRLGSVDIELIGWILTGVGVLSLVIGLVMLAMSRRSRVDEVVDIRSTSAAVVPPQTNVDRRHGI